MYACEADDVVPDIVTCAKGLGGGFQPIGAVLANDKIVNALAMGSGQLRHGHTYMAHPVACAAALAVQEAIKAGDLLSNVRLQGQRLKEALATAFAARPALRPHLGEVRGRGLLVAVELVAEASTLSPFDPALGVAVKIRRTAQNMGLICYPSAGTIDGRRGDHVLLAPPYIATAAEIELAVELTCRAVETVVSQVSSTTARQKRAKARPT